MWQKVSRISLWSAALSVLVLATTSDVSAQSDEFTGREQLRAHSNQFREEVIRVTEGVYVAVGYSASNVILIQGNDGSIIVDTASNPVEARAARTAFGNLLRAPVKAIIYTHNHPDHTGGASVFVGTDNPEIYSHELLVEESPDIARGMRNGGDQFGMSLPDSLYINAGIQMQYGRDSPPTREGYVLPTRTFSGGELSLSISGVQLQLLHLPGETRENVAVWLPEKRVLMPGDNFYRSFPNLSPVRGVRLRPPEVWIDSLEKKIALQADYLVPGHMRPLIGANLVLDALTAYRDGIKSIFDQTIAGIARGDRPDELVQQVRLPTHLADHPYLQEYYGSVEWTVRAIYADYVGWFDGNATQLFPLSEADRGSRIIDMIGGVGQALSRARDALTAGDFQWAAELTDYALAVESDNVDAKRIKAQALTELGERQINATARNYYLSAAQYLLMDL